MPVTLFQEKSALRVRMRAQRERHHRSSDMACVFADYFLNQVSIVPGSVVSGYIAMRGELDIAGLLARLRALGHPIVLPCVVGPYQPLEFRLYEASTSLVRSTMGLSEPSTLSPTMQPDTLLVPLLAFDRHRNRLGHGGGYYDRTLQSLKRQKNIQSIGVCFSYQEVLSVPCEAHDVPLDRIVTEVNAF